ncbi:hypothetical protein O181_114884 [Austropuccinia psidii MF-1]|uniref:Uncharacterized protein n=1 Tax=Austropuccinia psidii MF-1 TaxID=1389203 RepID=A0A9Q3K8N8_9BASI|nr:hypothetical protein [Austropuccinia psidii MF-1]
MLSQQMLLVEHKSSNTQRNMVESEELANELTKNTFHLISAINIATSWTVSMDDANALAEHWKEFLLSNQHLFPKQKSKKITILLIISLRSSNVGGQHKPHPHGLLKFDWSICKDAKK